MKKLLKCRKGVTLMELLVGMALCTLIIIAAMGIMLPIMGVISNINDFSEYNSLLNNLANHITSDLYQSVNEPENLNEYNSVTINGVVKLEYKVIDGILCRNGTPVLGDSYYRNKTVGFKVTEEDGVYILEIVILSKDGEELLTRDFAVKPFRLSDDFD